MGKSRENKSFPLIPIQVTGIATKIEWGQRNSDPTFDTTLIFKSLI